MLLEVSTDPWMFEQIPPLLTQAHICNLIFMSFIIFIYYLEREHMRL